MSPSMPTFARVPRPGGARRVGPAAVAGTVARTATARRRRLLAGTAVVVAAATALVGCTGGSSLDPTPSPPTPSPSATAPVELPEHAAGEQAAWVLEQLADGATAEVDEVGERFAAGFLAELPAEQVVQVLQQMRDLGPWTVASVEDAAPTGVLVGLAGEEQNLDMHLEVDADERIQLLLFTPAPPPREQATSWSDLADEVTALPASSASLLVAGVTDGRCVPVEGLPAGDTAGESLPLGSMIKLYVLGAVVDAVERGDLAWDDDVTVTDELRSLPSGRLQDEPAGTTVSVREAAELMISISDNTATDLLIDAVGRGAVEQALADMGHAEPAVNLPLITTRELFAVGWADRGELRRQWRDGDEATRRALLESIPPGQPAFDAATAAQTPAWVDGADWFGTAEDMCRALVALDERAATPAGVPVAEILSLNPGVGDVDGYDHVRFKGGSSIGTMAGAWWAEPAGGGDAVVVVLQTATRSPQNTLRGETMAGIVEDALRLAR